MPHEIVQHPQFDSDRSLGWLVGWWIEKFTVHGPGEVQGQPGLLTNEQYRFVVGAYSLNENARRLHTTSFYSRPKGCDKSGLAGRLVLAEAFGPVRFAGFAVGGETYTFMGHVYTYAKGEPMGKSVKVPFIRIMATEEDQAGNTYDTVYYNLTNRDAPLASMQGLGCQPGLLKTNLPGGGEIIPSTTGASSKDGGKETFFVADETHLHIKPGIKEAVQTVKRNLVKRGQGAWLLETTTMFAPGQESTAEDTYGRAKRQAEGRERRPSLYMDHRYGALLDDEGKPTDLDDETSLLRALEDAYGDSTWVDLEGVMDLIYDTTTPIDKAFRYYLNVQHDAKGQWLAGVLLEAAVERAKGLPPLADGDKVVIGFDGSINDDSTVIIICRIADGLLAVHHIQEQPDGPEAEDWAVDREQVDIAMDEAFEKYDVVGLYCDPPHFQSYVDGWALKYGDRLEVKATPSKPTEFWTNRQTEMVDAVDRLLLAFRDGIVAVEPGTALARHLINARSWKRPQGIVIGKETKHSPRKVDAAVAACIAWIARAHYLTRGKAKEAPKKPQIPIRVR